MPENRWARVDIKSTVSLLPNVLARRRRVSAAPMRHGSSTATACVTEGAASNAWIVTQDGRVHHPQADNGILSGITRSVLMEVLARLQLALEERAFTPDEA
jgi:D-alanine transaminase